ncbi:MAG: DNA-processing protein DprA [Candidatus Poribacteria bacterium]
MILDDHFESTKYWLAISSINDIGIKKIQILLKRFGSLESVFSASPVEIAELPRLNLAIAYEIIQTGKNLAKFEKFIEQIAKVGIQAICLDNPEYPNLLRFINNPPTIIYKKGKLSFDNSINVAIVGNRFPSEKSAKIAEQLAYELAKRKITVVSGLALGIDTYAHLGALKAKGNTIAVLGSGLQNIYPQENRKLAQTICRKGIIISECPPNQAVSKGMLIQRNRITSGLSLCVILIEPERGSLNTACWALKQNRYIFLYDPKRNFETEEEFSKIKNKYLTIKSIDDIDIILDSLKSIDVSKFLADEQPQKDLF